MRVLQVRPFNFLRKLKIKALSKQGGETVSEVTEETAKKTELEVKVIIEPSFNGRFQTPSLHLPH